MKIALDVARELGPGKTVVTVLCDTGERYIGGAAAGAARAISIAHTRASRGSG